MNLEINTKMGITKNEYDEINSINDCYYIAKKFTTFDILDSHGKIIYESVIPATVDEEKSKTLYITTKEDLFGLIKIENDRIAEVDAEFTSISEFKNGVAIVTIQYEFGLRYGLLAINLSDLLEPIYDNIYMLNNELYAASIKGKYGVYSIQKNKFIIPNEFKAVYLSTTEYGDSIVLL